MLRRQKQPSLLLPHLATTRSSVSPDRPPFRCAAPRLVLKLDRWPRWCRTGSMALVFSDPTLPNAAMEPSVTQMRCSKCKEVKPCCACSSGSCGHAAPSAFPPSCARWRRGTCKDCRQTLARAAPPIKRKFESARKRYGSVKSVTLGLVERLLREQGVDASDASELSQWRLVLVDPDKPFASDNVSWKRR